MMRYQHTALALAEPDSPPELPPSPSLSEPPPLWSRQVFGPSAIFAATAIGSGELIFWPGLTLSNGAGVLWVALAVVMLQFLMNIEIGRYSMATGESAVVGAGRLWRGWSWILLAGAIIPWLWPGWARAGSQLLGTALNVPEKPLTIVSLLVCGLLLASPSRVYATLERLQVVLLASIFAGVIALCALAVSIGDVRPFWGGFLTGRGIPRLFESVLAVDGSTFIALLSGIVFAGGGGILNLGYGLLLCEKRFAMGANAQPVVGLRHSLGLQAPTDRQQVLASDTETVRRWRGWLRLSRVEHGLLFLGGNALTIVVLALTFSMLLGPTSGRGVTFLVSVTDRFHEIGGPGAAWLFTCVAFAIFFTSEIGIIDITSRIGAGILHSMPRLSHESPSRLYHAIVWTEIAIGTALTVLDPRQPYWFLVTSAILNTVVMAIYAALVGWLNATTLPPFARSRGIGRWTTWIAAVVYGGLFLIVLRRLV